MTWLAVPCRTKSYFPRDLTNGVIECLKCGQSLTINRNKASTFEPPFAAIALQFPAVLAFFCKAKFDLWSKQAKGLRNGNKEIMATGIVRSFNHSKGYDFNN